MAKKAAAAAAAAAAKDSDDDEDSAGEASDGEDSNSDAKPAKKKSKGKAGDSPEDDALPAEGERITVQVDGILSDKTFDSLGLSKNTMAGIAELGYTQMTEVQARTIPPLLAGATSGPARTGSGKTLAFLIPSVELLFHAKFMPRNGTGVMVLSPTRELALQIYNVAQQLTKKHSQTHGLIIGGANRRVEAEKLVKGVNLLVATPAVCWITCRTQRFHVFVLKVFCMDEADRMLDIGFEEEMRTIVRMIPKDRQTMLFSATQTTKVEDLARLSLKSPDIRRGRRARGVDGDWGGAGDCVVPSEKRFLLLFTFLKKNLKKKIMVFSLRATP